MVRLNPWELVHLAESKGLTPRVFRDRYCEFGGILLRFDGRKGWKDLRACSQYIPNFGCSAHQGRPLACRLYPLGRQKQSDVSHYMFHGNDFPCLEGCPEVEDLPELTVAEYIAGQACENYELAQDAYLEVMQNLADGAFVLLLETGLAKSGDTQTLRMWRELGNAAPEQLATRLGTEWIERLMLPPLTQSGNPNTFAQQHYELLATQTQEAFSALKDFNALREASCVMMGLALHLGRGLGANPTSLVEHWITTAKAEGAVD